MKYRAAHWIRIMVAAWALILMPTAVMAGSCSASDMIDESGGDDVCGNTTPVTEHIFSWIACSFVKVLNTVLSQVYCAMQTALAPVAGALMTGYVALLGLQLLMGSVQFTAKEIVVRLLKLALVSTFISDSTWGITYAFGFFTDVANEGSKWVLESVQFAGSGDDVPSTYAFLDNLVYNAVANGPFTKANSKVVGFFAAMFVVFPPAFWMALAWLLENVKILGRCLLTYMLGLAALAFLIAMSPIFVSMMLFQSTFYMFESWLKYMISYSLQIVIIFACVAMWLAVSDNFVGFFDEISDTIVEDQFNALQGAQVTIADTWAICNHGPLVIDQGYVMVQCNSSPATAGDSKPLTAIPKDDDYMYVLVYNLVTLLIIAFAFSALIQRAPQFAQQLAGPEYVPSLAPGFGFTKYGQLQRMTQGGNAPTPLMSGGQFLGSTGGAGSVVQQFVQNTKQFMNTTIRKGPTAP